MTGEISKDNPVRISLKIGTAPRVIRIGSEEVETLQKLRAVVPDVIIMIEHGVFDFKRGRAIIHRDASGTLKKIDLEITKWSE